MRSLLLSVAFLAAAGVACLTPGSVSADRWGYHTPRYYQGYSYYPPSYGYGVPTVTPYSTQNVYIDPTGQVFTQSSGAYFQNVPVAPAFVPVYSGPQYFQGYAPPRLLVYPR